MFVFFLAMFVFLIRALRCTCSTNVCSVSYKCKYTRTSVSYPVICLALSVCHVSDC